MRITIRKLQYKITSCFIFAFCKQVKLCSSGFIECFSDEKERYDPTGFRDAIISGIDKCSNDFEAISRFLDSAGNKLDYRRYGECLFDILIAGGILGE